MNELIGLLTEKGFEVPLVGVTVKGDILGRGARVRVLQRFRNTEKRAVEAVYKFPLPEGVAICNFNVSIDKRVIRGQVEERERAFELYDDALSRGYGGYLLDEERPNIFTLSVGNLNPDSEATIEIEYVALLDMEDSSVRFVLPTTISPRYIPGLMPDKDGIPEHERIHPEYATDVPYGLNLSLNIHNGDLIKSIESPSHPININIGASPVTVTFSAESVSMDRDFVLNIDRKDSVSASRAYRYRTGKDTFLQVDLMLDEEAFGERSEEQEHREIIFVLDCSGSMMGDSIAEAKRALEICLRGLQEGSAFNIYRFGSTSESLFEHPESYNEKSLQKGLKYLERSYADLGGTELLTPLRDIYADISGKDRMERQIIILTDGEVGNEDEILKLVAENQDSTRVFPLGIGAGPNEYFIKGLARAARGAYEFIYPGERIEPKVLRTFQKLMQESLTDIRILWDSEVVDQSPESTAIFMGSPLTILAKCSVELWREPRITVKGNVGGKVHDWHIDVVEANSESLPIHTLWARERIRDLENPEGSFAQRGSRQVERKLKQVRATLIDLSKRYGLLSGATSFVAIEEREEKDKTTGEVVLRKVPTLVTVGWHGMGNVLGAAAPDMYSHADTAFYRMASSPTCSSFSEPRMLNSDMDLKSPMRSRFVDRCTREDKADILLSILSLQKAEGGFELEENVSRSLGLIHMKMRWIASDMEVGVEVDTFRLFSTALTLEVLEHHFSDMRSEWAALVQKSREWFDRILGDGKPRIQGEDLIAWVREYVKAHVLLI